MRTGGSRLLALDLSAIARVVDVCGGEGEVLAALLARWPHMRGILADQPEVLEGALAIRQPELDGRCLPFSGDVFESLPGGADLYLLVDVLSAWEDDWAGALLASISRAMAGRGRLLLTDPLQATPAAPFVRAEAALRELLERSGFALLSMEAADGHAIAWAAPEASA